MSLMLVMVFAVSIINSCFTEGVGMQWSMIARPYGPGDDSSMLHVFMMLVVDTVLYGIITWYFNEVLPGEVGTVRPFYFPFLASLFISGSTVRKLSKF